MKISMSSKLKLAVVSYWALRCRLLLCERDRSRCQWPSASHLRGESFDRMGETAASRRFVLHKDVYILSRMDSGVFSLLSHINHNVQKIHQIS